MITINGKYYPLWSQFVERKNEWIGGTLQDFGDSFSHYDIKTEIIDVSLEPNGNASAIFCVIGKDFNCAFDVRHGGIKAGEEGWITFEEYAGNTWRIKQKEKEGE